MCTFGSPGARIPVDSPCRLSVTHYPQAQVEYWTGQPAPSAEAWECARDEAVSVSGSPELQLQGLFGDGSDAATITLPRLGRYRVRVYVRGREHWLLQIWPS